MRLYNACKLRCPCVGLPPWVAEAVYYEILEQDLPAWMQLDKSGSPASSLVLEGLSVRGFVRWVLRVAMYRLQKQVEDDTKFHVILSQFLERHLKPHACEAPDDEFGRLANSKSVRRTIMTREFVLWAIFEFYATVVKEVLDEADMVEDAKLDTSVMEIEAFVALLEDS